MYLALPKRRVPNVERIGRHIEIAAEQNVTAGFAGLVKKISQTLQPVELEFEFIAPQLRPIRDISVDDPYAIYRRRYKAFLRFVIVVGEILLNVFWRIFRKDRDAVVRFLTIERREISSVMQFLIRKV